MILFIKNFKIIEFYIKICFNWNKLSIIDKSNWEDILSHIIYNEKNIPWLKIDKVIDKQVDFNY